MWQHENCALKRLKVRDSGFNNTIEKSIKCPKIRSCFTKLGWWQRKREVKMGR